MLNDAKDWTPNQLRFIYWLATPKIQREPTTQNEFAEKIGVNYTTVSRWKALPNLAGEVNRIARAELGKDLPEVYGTLRKLAIKGSFAHMKLYLELLEEYREEVDVNINDKREAYSERFARIAQEAGRPPGNGHYTPEILPNSN